MAPPENGFDRDKAFWENYNQGRPQPSLAFFERIFDYHRSHGGTFGTVHDIGAGNGPYASILKSRFERVVLSDIAASNMELAKERLGTYGFSYRVAGMDDASDIPNGSIDMVFATNVMHFATDQKATMSVFAKQLAPNGTFACAGFGPARFDHPELQDLWTRIYHEGGRELLRDEETADETAATMARTQGKYNVAPLVVSEFLPGAQRVHLNMAAGGLAGLLPPEEAHRNVEPDHSGPEDVDVSVEDDGWRFETDLAGVKRHICSFPFIRLGTGDMDALFKELDDRFVEGQTVRGVWPAKLILATRKTGFAHGAVN